MQLPVGARAIFTRWRQSKVHEHALVHRGGHIWPRSVGVVREEVPVKPFHTDRRCAGSPRQPECKRGQREEMLAGAAKTLVAPIAHKDRPDLICWVLFHTDGQSMHGM